MVHPVRRRQADVRFVQQLLAGITFIRNQKQIPNIERLARFMEREYGVKKIEVEKQLNLSVLDKLILSYTGVGFKGSKTGVEYEGFRIPDAGEVEIDDDGHDWYCFECHGPGEMYACSDCWRVFHAECQDEDTDDVSYLCAVCSVARKKKKTKRKLLNTLLSYTIVRLKEKTRELHRIGHREEEKRHIPLFVYKPIDLNKMEQKVMAHKYKCLEEFLADAHNVLHNMVLIYGDERDGMAELARIMIKDCKYDIDEMAQCQNCYYMSNAKPKHWFAQPCDPPHELVYARIKGYGHWPAKVIRYFENDRFDVRFFGGLHQRAILPKEQIKPIDTDNKKLAIKKTGGFVKAVKELEVYQKLLQEKKDQEEEEEEEEEEMPEELEREEPLLKKEKKQKKIREDVQETEPVRQQPKLKAERKERKEKVKDDAIDTPDTVTSSSTTPKRSRSKKRTPPEDANLVTSTEEYNQPAKRPKLSTSNSASQTMEKSSHTVSSQTDDVEELSKDIEAISSLDDTTTSSSSEPSSPKKCNCEAKHAKVVSDLKEKLDRVNKEHKANEKKSIEELSERLKKDFEEDKQAAVSRAMGKLQTELDRVRRQTEDKCKEQYKEEMKKLAQKHKESISSTKKKQWCFNCEEEAMYHCCWNTSYCSVKCQQEHWHKEHKRVCRRKRN